MGELTLTTASGLAQAIRDGQMSSREVVDAHVARIEAVNAKLNTVAQLNVESARTRAAEADDALARGEVWGLLHGVPFTVKDWIETNDAICAANFEERRAYVPKRDATAVARMRAAGGIMLGKTVDLRDNKVYGKVYNPHDITRTPGGSSSGEAAIIAAGGSPLGLGSDSGGSIRYPAHCCGVAGLKPTNGRVPLTGHFPRVGALSDPRTTIGPLARWVEDLALALEVIAGSDGIDPRVAPVPLGDWHAVDVAGLRVAMFSSFDGAKCDHVTELAVQDAARALADAGAVVDESVPPRIEESLSITRRYWARTRSSAWNEWQGGRGSTLTADEVEQSIFEWERLQRAFLSFMQSYDAILCPASPSAAVAHEKDDSDQAFVYTLPFSLTGQPAVVVRAGTSREGLPIGVQVVARKWRDDVALALAARIEDALGGWQEPKI
jgi:amidase